MFLSSALSHLASAKLPSHSRLASLGRLGKPAILAAAFGAVAFTAVPASAGECINGYRQLGNQVIVACKDAAAPAAPHTPLLRNSYAEPITTGSINAPSAKRSGAMTVHKVTECQPGHYRVTALENGEMMLPCK